MAWNYYGVKDRGKIKVLDAGCGPGACTWYLAREGFSVYGIDGSKTAIYLATKRLEAEGLKAELVVGDLIQLPYPSEYFDGVIDIASIQHNTLANIGEIVTEIYRVLRTGGKFFSMAVKAGSYGYGEGDIIERNTFTNARVGPPKGKGVIHFFRESEIRDLLTLNQFKNIEIEWSTRTVNNQKTKLSNWVATAER